MQKFGQDISTCWQLISGSGTGSSLRIWGRALALVCRFVGLLVEMVALVCQSQNWVHWPIHFYHCKFKFLISFLHIILKIEIWILFLEIHTEETRHLMVCTGFPFQRMRILNPTRIYSTSKSKRNLKNGTRVYFALLYSNIISCLASLANCSP